MRNGVSQYEPIRYGADQEVENLEMECVKHGILIKDLGHKKTFYRKMDHVVGACSGDTTCYVFAEITSGFVHGRPISEKALKQNYGVVL